MERVGDDKASIAEQIQPFPRRGKTGRAETMGREPKRIEGNNAGAHAKLLANPDGIGDHIRIRIKHVQKDVARIKRKPGAIAEAIP